MGGVGALLEHEKLREIIDRSAGGELLTVTDRSFLRSIANSLERPAVWWSIETAPRDGTRILVRYWHEQYTSVAQWSDSGKGWYRSDDGTSIEPTKWVPIPPNTPLMPSTNA